MRRDRWLPWIAAAAAYAPGAGLAYLLAATREDEKSVDLALVDAPAELSIDAAA